MTQEECRIDKEEVKEAIRLNHLQNMKEAMQGEKLRAMAMTDMRDRRPYTKYHVEECRMAFRLETYQFDCQANMPTRYGRDLRCRACCPQTEGQPDLKDLEGGVYREPRAFGGVQGICRSLAGPGALFPTV